jgi:Protein of unknown function (DUF3309)
LWSSKSIPDDANYFQFIPEITMSIGTILLIILIIILLGGFSGFGGGRFYGTGYYGGGGLGLIIVILLILVLLGRIWDALSGEHCWVAIDIIDKRKTEFGWDASAWNSGHRAPEIQAIVP